MISLSLVFLAPLVLTATSVNVPVTTKYITTNVTTLAQNESVILVGSLCGQAKGDGMNVTMVLLHNPHWFVDAGVINYFVVDSQNKTEKDALCTNIDQGKPGPYCSVSSWPSEGDLYIKGHNPFVEAVTFTLDAEKIDKLGTTKVRGKPPAYSKLEDFSEKISTGRKFQMTTVFLTEIITVTASQSVPWLQEAHLNYSFCPSPDIGSWYSITSTVFGTDGESSWAQYICDKFPCELTSSKNIVAFNGKELPSNTVVTASGQWKQMYVLIVCWGGPFDKTKGQYIGHFQFNAVAERSAAPGI